MILAVHTVDARSATDGAETPASHCGAAWLPPEGASVEGGTQRPRHAVSCPRGGRMSAVTTVGKAALPRANVS